MIISQVEQTGITGGGFINLKFFTVLMESRQWETTLPNLASKLLEPRQTCLLHDELTVNKRVYLET